LESAGAVILTASTLMTRFARLDERGIPFLIYNGFKDAGGPCGYAPHIDKPASPVQIVTAMVDLLFQKQLAQ
jgi:hypothetical protein